MGRPSTINNPSGATDDDGNPLTIAQLAIQNVSLGLTHRDAAAASGISPAVFAKWKGRGRRAIQEGKPYPDNELTYVDFVERIERAEAAARARYLKQIEAAGTKPHTVKKITRKTAHLGRFDDDGAPLLEEIERSEVVEQRPPTWQATAWLLERRWPNYRLHWTPEEETQEDPEVVARQFADELRAYMLGHGDAKELGDGHPLADDPDVIDANSSETG